MSTHLAELMADAELYRWEATRSFHSVWLQQLEQSTVTWKDTELRTAYHHTLVWHRLATWSKQASAAAGTRNTTPFNVLAKPGAKACQTYNKGGCALAEQHPKELHICAYCLVTLNRLCAYQEKFCQ